MTTSEVIDAKTLAEQESRLAAYSGPDEVISRAEMEARIKATPRPTVKVFSKMAQLDRLTDGFCGGELYAISGPPKNGKTLFAQSLTTRFAEQGLKSVWFTFEVPVPQFLSQVPGGLEFYLPATLTPNRPDWLEDRIVESKLKHGTRAVFIDHLHFLLDLEKGGRNFSVDIGAVIRRLKRIAVRHNLILFLLCHATKTVTENGEMRELNAFDIRDSSFVPQEADSTIIIQRKLDKATKEFNNRAMLKVCNHRRTGVMDKRITLEKVGMLFDEAADQGQPKAEPQPKYYKDWLAEQEDARNDSVPF